MRVPEAQREVRQQGLPDARLTARTSAENFLNPTEQMGLGLAGQAFGAVEKTAVDIAGQQLEEADQARFLDARNTTQAKINSSLFDAHDGYFQKSGAAAFEPVADGRAPGAAALEDLRQHVNDTASGLGSENQKRLYLEWANQNLTHVGGQIQQHEGQQFRVFQRGVGLSTISTNQQTMGLNYNNPAMLQSGIAGIQQASANLAKLEGYPAEYGAAQGQKHVSEALSGAINSALMQNDHASATKILHDFSAQMETNDMLKNYEAISKVRDAQASYGIAQGVMGQVLPKLQTSDADRALNILFDAESGGKHFVDGTTSPITSAKGAVGIAQVMPGTGPEAAKLAGLRWDPKLLESEPEYNRALGIAYFKEQLRSFGGDLGMAYAAYNAGPGATKEAVAKAGREGGNWLQYLPAETQNYVTKNMNAYASGEGQFKRPTLADAIASADERLGPNAPPSFRKQVRDEVTNQYELQDKAIKQREDEAMSEGYRQLLQNGGKFSALPVAVRSAVPPDKVDSLMNFAKKLSEGAPIATDWGLYYKLKTDPALLRNTNLMAFRDKLNDTEFKQLAGEQTSGTHAEALTRVRRAGEILKSYMVAAGIDPSPKPNQKDQAATVGRIWSAFEQRVADFEQQAGHKATTQDLEKVAARMFVQVPVSTWIGSTDKPAVLVDSQKDSVKVPDEDRQQIVEAWQRVHPGEAITDRQVDYFYLKSKGVVVGRFKANF